MNNSNFRVLDLHGEHREIVKILVNDFITDAIKLNIAEVVIIHGKGKGILKKELREVLKQDKRVLESKVNFFNDGETIVKLRQYLTK